MPEPSEENAAGLQQMDTLDRNFGWPAMSSKPFETDAWHQHYLEQQFEAYRKSFGDRVKDGDVLSTEKLRKRRVVDVEVFLTVDGSAAPRYSMKRQVSEELKRMFF